MKLIRYPLAVLGLALFVVWFVLLRPQFLGGATSYVMVSGVSMQPTLWTGDLVVTRAEPSYAIGDVVAYNTGAGMVIHRIVGGDATNGFVMQGDNNNGTDPWAPRQQQIAGKQWLLLPGAGNWLTAIRRPFPFALLMGALTGSAFLGRSQLRRRRNGRWKQMGKQLGKGGHMPAPAWLVGVFGALCMVVTLSAVIGWTAFRSRTERTQTVDHLSYNETASFDYSAKLQPSILYPGGVVGPVTADSSKDAPRTIYTSASPAIDLGFHYAMKPVNAPPAIGFGGEVSAVVKISSGEQGWTKTLDLLLPTPFTGTSTDVRLSLDLPKIQALIQTIETETKFTSTAYEVTVIPTVHVAGKLGANAVDDTFAPPFTIKLTKSQVTLDQSLARSETRKQEDRVTVPQQMSVFGMGMSVSRARLVSASVAAVSLAGALAAAAVIFLGIGRGEAARIRARYGSMVISVTDAHLPSDEALQIRLASIQDLVRLANKDSRMVFHQVRPDGSDVYFVQDGTLTYLYVSAGRPAPVVSKVQEA